jgi:hypothetical protein
MLKIPMMRPQRPKKLPKLKRPKLKRRPMQSLLLREERNTLRDERKKPKRLIVTATKRKTITLERLVYYEKREVPI